MISTLRPALAALVAVLAAACGSGPSSDASAPSSPAPAVASDQGPGATAGGSGGTSPAPASGLYEGPQADRGQEVFRRSCSECHYSSEMRGTQFQFQWERRTVGDLYEHLVETMPEDAPGSLSSGEYLAVVAYILRLNGFPEGAGALEAGGAAFDMSLEAPSGAR